MTAELPHDATRRERELPTTATFGVAARTALASFVHFASQVGGAEPDSSGDPPAPISTPLVLRRANRDP